MKPISTLMSPLKTVDLTTGGEANAQSERSDVTAVPAMGVIAGGHGGLVLADAMLEKFGMRLVVRDELQAIKDTYGDRRRTHIVQLKEGESKSSLLTKPSGRGEEIWVCVSQEGLISRTTDDKLPRISGKERPAGWSRCPAAIRLFVDEQGEAAAIPVHAIPESDDIFQVCPSGKNLPTARRGRPGRSFLAAFPQARAQKTTALGQPLYFTATSQGMVQEIRLERPAGRLC